MAQHTPGPWIADIDAHYAEGLPLTILSTTSGEGIAGIAGHADPLDDDGGATAETYANARLIAAAPELLAALRDMEAAREHGCDLPWGTVRAAIAKAEGTP